MDIVSFAAQRMLSRMLLMPDQIKIALVLNFDPDLSESFRPGQGESRPLVIVMKNVHC